MEAAHDIRALVVAGEFPLDKPLIESLIPHRIKFQKFGR